VRPQIVLNAAAYTAVDRAESDAAAAFAINRDGAGALARACESAGCPIVHISTDYVFDGSKTDPYVETDTTNPIGVYGRSKLEGEAAVAAANSRHLIVRTAWLYAPYGQNFLRTMLRLASERAELRVVGDQHGNPTYVPHLADVLLALAGRIAAVPQDQPWGIYHAAGLGDATWAQFAAAIVRAGARLGVPEIPVRPIPTDEYPTPVRRPANSRLDCGKLQRTFGLQLPSWQQGLRDCTARLSIGEASWQFGA
jgi:dTDP-4-dehydrorhamnose reductase